MQSSSGHHLGRRECFGDRAEACAKRAGNVLVNILGPGWFLLDVQAHYNISGELVQGGQLLAMFDPTAAG